MGVINQAIALEERAEAHYRDAALKTTDSSASKVLRLLAEEEAKHARSLRDLEAPEDLSGPDLVKEAQTWIHGLVEGGVSVLSPDQSLLSLLREAMDIERATESFYREQAEAAEIDELKRLFARLAEIEHEHFQFVSSLVEYYDRPNEWIEDSEFGLRSEY